MNTRRKYKAAFLLPANSKKILTENGWEFETNKALNDDVLKSTLMAFGQLEKGSVDVNTYRKEDLIIDILVDEKEIEQIYIRDYSIDNHNIDLLKSIYSSHKDVEVFIP